MDPDWQWQWQGGDPASGRGFYYNSYTGQRRLHHPGRHEHLVEDATALQLFTSRPEFQPRGGYIGTGPSSGVVLIPTHRMRNISGHGFLPLADPMPGIPSDHYSDLASVPNVIGSQHQPHPGSAPVFPAPRYNYNNELIPYTSVNLPEAPLYAQPGAATGFSARDGNTNNGPHTSAGLIAPPANANLGASRGPAAGGVPDPSRLALQDVWANDLLHIVHQAARTPHNLEFMLDRVIWHHYNGAPLTLMEVANVSFGEWALKELARLAALQLGAGALWRLFKCLVDGWIMEQSNGSHLLQHFFTTFGFVHCSIFIDELAIPRFWEMVTSRLGYMSMLACLDYGVYTTQGPALHNAIVTHTVRIARDAVGSLLMRNVLERGRSDQLKERIRERVEDNLVELCMCQYGNTVVQACFIPDIRMASHYLVPLLQRWLRAFLRQPGVQLLDLLQNQRARYVLFRLLQKSVVRNAAWQETTPLAQRILGVGAAGDETLSSIARQVIRDRESRQ